MDKCIKDYRYKIGTSVAFSGEVNDKESGPDEFHREQQGSESQPTYVFDFVNRAEEIPLAVTLPPGCGPSLRRTTA